MGLMGRVFEIEYLALAAQEDQRPLFYLNGFKIHKRPVSEKTEKGTRISLGFPVCEVSDCVEPQVLLNFFNEHGK